MATSPRKPAARETAPANPGKSPAAPTVQAFNGLDLNLLGSREPAICGDAALADVARMKG